MQEALTKAHAKKNIWQSKSLGTKLIYCIICASECGLYGWIMFLLSVGVGCLPDGMDEVLMGKVVDMIEIKWGSCSSCESSRFKC